jgi:5-methylcytosine-specific restriction endonuclease McrA
MAQRTHLDEKEVAAYRAATDRARAAEGYLRCEGCGRSLLDGQEQRHHIRYRSQGGPTTPDNLLVLCLACHGLAHHLRIADPHWPGVPADGPTNN